MSSKIEVTFIDLNLMSGSVDKFRATFGGYWKIEEDETTTSADFVKLGSGDRDSYGLSRVADSYDLGGRMVEEVPYFSYIVTNTQLVTTASAPLFFPSVKFPVRLIGNASEIIDDVHWRAIIRGGSYGTSSFAGVIPPGNFTNCMFQVDRPYDLRYVKLNDYTNFSAYTPCEITYDYNYSFPQYQAHVAGTNLVTEIPNYYHLSSYYLGLSADMPESIVNSIDIEGTTQIEEFIFEPVITPYLPLYDVEASDYAASTDSSLSENLFLNRRENFINYITGSVIANQLSGGTVATVNGTTRNLIFNSDSQEELFDAVREGGPLPSLMPFMAKIKLPLESPSDLGSYIQSAKCENLVLNYIKDKFLDNPSTAPQKTFKVIKNFISSSDSVITDYETVGNHSYRHFDLFNMIKEVVETAEEAQPSNFDLVGGLKTQRREIINKDGTYRHFRAAPALKLLDNLNDFFAYKVDTVADDYYFQVEDLLNLGGSDSHSEVLAYGIQKTTTVRLEEAARQAPVQNYLFWNDASLSEASEGEGLTFYDSQVKYGAPYTYIIYAYVAVYELNYKYTDVRTTNTLASSSADSGYCLQFQSSNNQSTVPQLLFTDTDLLENRYATNQITSNYKYLADFNVSIEPSIKVYQIPIANKTIRILDHPPPRVDVTPYQRKDNSQIIGFFIQQESAATEKYPAPIVIKDIEKKSQYMVSNNLVEGELSSKFSRSRIKAVEVYRRTQKPLALSDFTQEDLVFQKDLKIPGSRFKLSNCLYEEKISTNTKYYYLFRFLSENNMPGNPGPVIEAELINDGGYKYAIFDTLSEEELQMPPHRPQSIDFKKLFQLIPNAAQTEFDDTEVDYDGTASAQIENLQVGSAEDNLWGKTFKIRLTSKKTGKKIDFNVSYNLKHR